MKLRFHPKSFGIFLAVLLVEIGIALYVRDAFIRPFVGDVLVVVLMFYALACVLQTNLRKLMWGVLAFAFFVEILQYFHIRDVLHLQNKALRVMVGGTFDFMDLLAYCTGAAAVFWAAVWPSERPSRDSHLASPTSSAAPVSKQRADPRPSQP